MTEENRPVLNKALLEKEHSNMWKWHTEMFTAMVLMPDYEDKKDLEDCLTNIKLYLMVQKKKYDLTIKMKWDR